MRASAARPVKQSLRRLRPLRLTTSVTDPRKPASLIYALRIQDGRLPLHYAAEKGATLAVVELLLGPESNAATATAADKARLPLCIIATARTSSAHNCVSLP